MVVYKNGGSPKWSCNKEIQKEGNQPKWNLYSRFGESRNSMDLYISDLGLIKINFNFLSFSDTVSLLNSS